MLSPKSLAFLNRLNRHTLVELAAVSAGAKPAGHIHNRFSLKQDWETVNNLLRELEIPVWQDPSLRSTRPKPRDINEVRNVRGWLKVSRNQLEEAKKSISFPIVKKVNGESEAYFQISMKELAATKEGKLVKLDGPLYLSGDEKFLDKPFETDFIATSFHAIAYGYGTGSLNKDEATIVTGLALGYPRCCAEAAAQHRFIDTLSINEGPTELLFLIHSPCKLECKESLKIGRAYLEAVRSKLHPKFVDKVILGKKRSLEDTKKNIEIRAQLYLKEAFTPSKAIEIDKALLRGDRFSFLETKDGKFYLSEIGKRLAHERFERGFYPFSRN